MDGASRLFEAPAGAGSTALGYQSLEALAREWIRHRDAVEALSRLPFATPQARGRRRRRATRRRRTAAMSALGCALWVTAMGGAYLAGLRSREVADAKPTIAAIPLPVPLTESIGDRAADSPHLDAADAAPAEASHAGGSAPTIAAEVETAPALSGTSVEARAPEEPAVAAQVAERSPPAVSAAPAAPSAPAPSGTARRALPPEEVALLLRRGESLLGVGDIAAARLFFTRAAESGDARAALRLGETFDPLFLERLRTLGIAADPQRALAWYRQAADRDDEAAGRLERLLERLTQGKGQ